MTGMDFSHARVNLMPRAEIERRRRGRVARGWVVVVIIAAVLAVGLVGGAWAAKTFADQRLAQEQERTGALAVQLEGYRDVSGALRMQESLIRMRATAMGADLSWTALVDRIRGHLPGGVTLGWYTIASGPAVGDEPAGPSGTITLTTANLALLTAAADAISDDDAVNSIALQRVETTDGLFNATFTIAFTAAVNSGTYTAEVSE